MKSPVMDWLFSAPAGNSTVLLIPGNTAEIYAASEVVMLPLRDGLYWRVLEI